MVSADELKTYFEKARRFDQDRVIQVERSARIAWSVAIVAGILAGASIFAVAALTPLKTIEPFVVRVDNSTGIVDVVSALTSTAGTYDEAVTKYFAAKYVRARKAMSGVRRRRTSAPSPCCRRSRSKLVFRPSIAAAIQTRRRIPTGAAPQRASASRRSR